MPDRITYRVNEVLAMTGLSRSTLYRLVARGELPLVKVCGRTLIARDDLEAMLRRMRHSRATLRHSVSRT
ncbi:helix-turn-helix domain-containing protein [Phenylobacterium sp.]|jgi:excisionase family DNA binding protein|uniref:helix-turn-helix domain-containing protein n=1 Tax=Phenylobacterium sp. TaxID=1871053 RepID=UPI000C98068A|nr:helix-turn-helix domain-containing protein [Phenylobacterium sp.]MAK83978.1 transcriptional regulator [Phenylobacterium sp.]|tara:strand:- start:23320 stop:23529 length:210 start_codon:yes stop_codon:yes gene_type:complete